MATAAPTNANSGQELANGSRAWSSNMDSLQSLVNGMNQRYKEETERLMGKPPRILLIGPAGVGKSTLVNNVFGLSDSEGATVRGGGRPCTQIFREYGPFPGCPVCIIDSKGIERESAEQTQVSIVNYVRDKRDQPDVADRVHVVWYLPGNRWDSTDVSYVKDLKDYAPVIAVITKCDTDMRNQIDRRTGKPAKDATHDEIKATFPDIPVIFCGDPRRSNNWLPASCSAGHSSKMYFSFRNMDRSWKCEFPIRTAPEGICGEVGQGNMSFFGYEELAKKTKTSIPEVVQIAFLHAQRIDIEGKNKEAAKIIFMNVAAAVGVAVVPLAVPDAPALLAIEGNMTMSLFQLYNMPNTFIDLSVFAAINGAAIGGVGLFSYTVAKLLKLSAVGAVAGSVVDGAVAGVSGIVIGIAVARVCAMWSIRERHEEGMSTIEFSALVTEVIGQVRLDQVAKAMFLYLMHGEADGITNVITSVVAPGP